MNILSFLYTEVLYRPILNLVVGITNVLPGHNMGWAIIIVTIIVRLILVPFSLHQVKHMRSQQGKMTSVRDEIEKIKKKYKNDKAKQAEETMRLYRKEGINPAGGCLPLLIQLPILIALYRVFLTELTPEAHQFLYSFVSIPTEVNSTFFSISLNTPSLLLGILAGIGQFVQTKWLAPQQQSPQPGVSDDTAAMMQSMQRNMTYIFPVMTVFIALQLPAALSLYWAVTTAFGIIQQYIIKKALHVDSNVPVM